MEKCKGEDKVISRIICFKECLLGQIISSEWPLNPALHVRHKEQMAKAKVFLEELKEVHSYLDFGLPIKVVPLSVYNRQLEKADFATIEFDGLFCKIAIVQNFPSDEKFWLIYTAPIEQI